MDHEDDIRGEQDEEIADPNLNEHEPPIAEEQESGAPRTEGEAQGSER